MKCLGVDYGLARTGVAACDPGGILAFPLATLRLDDFPGRRELLDALAAMAAREGAEAVVMGLPLMEDGAETLTTRQVRNAARRLERRLSVPLYFMPELLSSEEAWQDLREAGVARARRGGALDRQAAVRILQSFLNQEPERRIRADGGHDAGRTAP